MLNDDIYSFRYSFNNQSKLFIFSMCTHQVYKVKWICKYQFHKRFSEWSSNSGIETQSSLMFGRKLLVEPTYNNMVTGVRKQQ